jgi:hypothetical protein
MLVGVFLVPAALLWAGHRLRRRSPRWRRGFWGALIGHVTALVVASIAGMTPPEEWASTDMMRGLLAYWSFVLFPAVGALLAVVTNRDH